LLSESQFQAKLKKKLEKLFPGCIVLKNDPELRPGIPDLLILFHGKWAALEVKVSATAKHQPLQDWYVSTMDEMSFAAFIHPSNEQDVLRALQQALVP
jgi:hypothetical protein